jgi:hypothetical protein
MLSGDLTFILISGLVSGVLGVVLLFFPHRIANWQAERVKFLREQLLRADAQSLSPGQKAFVERVVERSEKVSTSTRLYRIVGAFLLFQTVVSLLLAGLSAYAGINPFDLLR